MQDGHGAARREEDVGVVREERVEREGKRVGVGRGVADVDIPEEAEARIRRCVVKFVRAVLSPGEPAKNARVRENESARTFTSG